MRSESSAVVRLPSSVRPRPDAGPDKDDTSEDVEALTHAVLIVSYHFPPDGRVGAVRPAKFAKYLSRLGWKPYVLTVKTRHIPVEEPERLRDVTAIPISRTSVWPTPLDALVRLRNAARNVLRPRAGGPDGTGAGVTPPQTAGGEYGSLARRLLHLLFEFPDSEVGWVIPAVWQGYRIIRRERIGVVLVTSPPRSSVFIGLMLSWLTGCRLITDLRDPWFSTGVATGDLSRPERLKVWLERRLMERSHQVITTAALYTEWLRTNYASLPGGKFHTITNGFDAEDLEAIDALASDGRFTMTYLGTFYWTRTPRPLLAALAELVAEGVVPRECVRVNFIGTVTQAVGEDVAQVVRDHGLEDIVSLRGVVPYRESLAEMKRADALILLAPEEQYYGIPAKTFEYLAMERPVLCLGDQGATARLIREADAGPVVHSNDVPAIKRAVVRLFADWQSGRAAPPAIDRGRFERATLTRDLIAVMTRES